MEKQPADDALEQSHARLELLRSIAAAIAAETPGEQIIEHAARELSERFPDLRAAFGAIDEQFKITIQFSIEPRTMPPIQGLEADLTKAPTYLRALRRGEPIAVEDVKGDRRMGPLADAMAAGATRAALDVPVRYASELVGLLCLDSPIPHAWTEEQVATLSEVAALLSVAIGVARARQERDQAEEALQQAREELEGSVERHMPQGRTYGLTFREFTVLHLVAAGKADKEIALELGISSLTVSKHVANILAKMGASSRTEAGVRALREGLLD